MKKLSNIETELNKSVAYKKGCIGIYLPNEILVYFFEEHSWLTIAIL